MKNSLVNGGFQIGIRPITVFSLTRGTKGDN